MDIIRLGNLQLSLFLMILIGLFLRKRTSWMNRGNAA